MDPKQATGKLHKLWMDFAKFYEGHGDVANARVIFEKATLVAYRCYKIPVQYDGRDLIGADSNKK